MNPNDVHAFPHTEWTHGGDTILSESPGMTLRDYFAARAMHAILSNPEFPQEFDVSGAAYEAADAMLAARGQP